MPQVLTTNATILCPHGGQGTTTASTSFVDAGGTVTVEGDTGTLACPYVQVPCVGYTLASMGLNATTIDGKKVILVTDLQKSQTGLPLTLTETTTMFDDSTTAPLPSGTSSQAIAPELLDVAPPIVTALPPSVPFTISLMQPATVPVVFSLSAAFPMSWTLTLLNSTTGQAVDATNGLPTGLVVVPPGGEWSSPVLMITATLSAAFMASLGPGSHKLFIAGATKRGLSASAEVTVVVS